MSTHKLVNGELVELTAEEIEARAQAEAQYESTIYLSLRQRQYPHLEEQLDMLFHELEQTGSISTSGQWYNTINQIKLNNPKPS